MGSEVPETEVSQSESIQSKAAGNVSQTDLEGQLTTARTEREDCCGGVGAQHQGQIRLRADRPSQPRVGEGVASNCECCLRLKCL